jgi:ketosteroid isomerase-like protein
MKKIAALATFACATTSGALHPKDAKTARDQVTALLAAQEAALTAGDFATMATYLTPDATWVGPRAEQALAGRDAVKTALAGHLAGKKIAVSASAPRVGLAADGRSAWASEDLSLTIGDDADQIPTRLTAFLVDDGKVWKIAAEEFSVGVPNEKAFDLAAKGQLATPAALPDAAPPGTEALVAAWKQGMADPVAWAKSFANRDDAFVYGSAPGENVSGGQAIQQTFADQSAKYKIKMEPLGGLRAAVARSGASGYVAGNVALTVDSGDGKTVTQEFRVMLVYLKDGASWRPVLAHFSNGM